MKTALLKGPTFVLLLLLSITCGAQGFHFIVGNGLPNGSFEGTPIVRTSYLCNVQEINADLEEEGFIRLPFRGTESERFNILPRLTFGPSVELPAADYAVWPLISEHWTGAAMRKNGFFYFRFYAPAAQAKNFYFELTSVGVPGYMELCYYDGNTDLPYPTMSGSGVVQTQADFDAIILNDADFDEDSLPLAQTPEASIYTNPNLSAQVFGQTVNLATPRLLRTIFSVSPRFATAAMSTQWMNSASTHYELLDFVALRVAMMNTISFRETALMLSIEHVVAYSAVEFYMAWSPAHALHPSQGDENWSEPIPAYTVADNRIEDEDRWARGWTGSYLMKVWADQNGVEYDMGHNFFDTAAAGSPTSKVCNTSSSGLYKGYVTAGPAGQPGWDMNYGVAMHEIGHIYGARHTFNYAHPKSRSRHMAREPGSGLSIMGYVRTGTLNYDFTNTSGAEQTAKVSFSGFDMVFNEMKAQPNPLSAYHEYYLRYHPASLGEIEMHTGVDALPATCAVPMDLPQAVLSMPEMTHGLQETNEIPVNTPFVLSVAGGEERLYSWSQNESGDQFWDYFDDIMCLESSTYGPLFLFGQRSTTGDRCFPPFDKMDEGEEYERHFALPETPRSMTFALTVQNNPSVSPVAHGSAVYDGIKVNVSGTTPFAMTGGPGIDETELFTDAFGDNALLPGVEVTWDPGNTNAAPISCSNVNIYYLQGDDNGEFLSNAITLASAVPNNGSATIDIPASPVTTGPDGVAPMPCRIVVKSPDHIFFAASPKFTVIKSGCKDMLASNFDPAVGLNVPEVCTYDNNVNACNHPLACNFNWSDSEESTCIFPLCQDPEALNYEPFFPMYSDFVSEGCGVNCLYEETPCSGLPGYEDADAGFWVVQGSEGLMDLTDWTIRMGIGNGERLDESQGATRRMEWLADGRIFEIRPSDFAALTSGGVADKSLLWEIESPVFSVGRKVKWTADWATASATDEGGYFYNAYVCLGNQATPIMAFTGADGWTEVPAHASLKINVIRPPQDSDTALLFSLSGLAHEDKCFAGCTDASATNFNAEATEDDGSCFFLSNPGEGFNQGEDEESPQVCRDAQACNYVVDLSFGIHTPSMCTYPGCQLPFADNYDPYAGCGGTCCYHGVCADQTWWEAQGRRVVHGAEWTDLFTGDWLAADVIEHLDDVDLQGTGLLIELPPGGMEIEFSSSGAQGIFEMGFALLNFPGNELPSLTWEGNVTFDMLEEPKGWSDMEQATRDFLLAPQALPFYDDLELPAEKETTSGFYYRLGESVNGNAKIVVGQTPEGSSPPALLLSGLVMDDVQLCTGEAGVPGCTDPEALNFDPAATIDDGTCTAGGCMDAQAVNYDPGAWLPRAECLYAGPCGDLQVNEAEGFGFTGAFQPAAMSSTNRPDLTEFLGDNAVVLSSADEGSADTTWVEWAAPTSGLVWFAWRYATDDGIIYDIPFVSVNGGPMQTLNPGGNMAANWTGTGNETDDGLLWQPGANSLPDSAALPAIFHTANTAYGWMGPVAVEVAEGATMRLGMRTTDGVYGAGHLAVASWVWPHGCATAIPGVAGCTDAAACNFNPSAATDDGSCFLPGAACNDANACTFGDVITADCICAGTFVDSDGDGTCDVEDGCPNNPDLIEPNACGCASAIYVEGNGWLLPCSGLLGGCDHPIAFNYNPEAIAPSTCLYEGPCGAWTTLDGETVGLTGGLSFDNWTVSGTADGEVFANETYLMLATDGDATAGAEIAASFEMPVSGTLQFSWAQLLTHEPTTFDENWTPYYSINGGPKVYLDPFYDFRSGSLSGSPTTPDFNFDAWATEDPDFFSLGTFAPGDSLVLPPLNQVATVDNPWAYAAVPFHDVVTLELQAEDQIHFALQPHPTTAAAKAVFAGWLSPAGACNDISGCTYPQACNYNPEASQEDGSCTFAEPLFDCDGNPLVAENLCPEDVDNDGFVAVNDLLLLLSAFGDACE